MHRSREVGQGRTISAGSVKEWGQAWKDTGGVEISKNSGRRGVRDSVNQSQNHQEMRPENVEFDFSTSYEKFQMT